MSRSVLTKIIVSIITLAATSAVQAGVLNVGTYQLGNHTDGSARPPSYGLRLDELFNINSSQHDIWTFDFENPSSDMKLAYDGSSIHIFGTVFGGLDIGTAYSATNSGLFNVDFTYQTVSTLLGDDDLIAYPTNATTNIGAGSGTIQWINAPNVGFGNPISLVDYAGDFGYTFQLGDEFNDAGHRDYPGISGWGWLIHQPPNNHIGSSDWLFTVNPVPLPGSGVLVAIGLAGVGLRRSRRKS